MPCELTVIVKDSEKTLRSKHLIYENIELRQDDLTIQKCICEALKGFIGQPESVKIKISMIIE